MPVDKTVFVPLSPDAVFELITQPERLRRWHTVAARVDLRVGGDYRWTIVPGHHAAGSFTEVEPGKRVIFSWGWEDAADLPPRASTVTITLDAVDAGTNVRLVHEGLNEQQAASHAEGWDHYLDRLALLGRTGDAGADAWMAATEPRDPLVSADAALAIVQRVLRGLSERDLDKPTPCTEFNVGQLVDHLYDSIAGIGSALGVETAAAMEADAAHHPGTESQSPEPRIADVAQKSLEAFQRRGLAGTVDLGFAQLPAATVANILNLELLVHAWDLAAATEQRIEVPPALSSYILELARETINDPLRQGGSFAAATWVAESANSIDRLIAFTGRKVSAA